MFQSLTDGLYKTCEWFMHLAFINILWGGFTLLGLGLFGWAPATAASIGVFRKLILSPNEEIPLFRTFFQLYRKEFIRANQMGFLIKFAVITLLVSLSILNEMTHVLSLKLLWIAVFILICMISLLMFPVSLHYQVSTLQSIRYALLIGLAKLHYFVVLLFLLTLLGFLYVTLPGAMVFYLISLPAILITLVSLKMFASIDETSRNSARTT